MPPAAKDPTHAELAGMVKVGQIFDWLKADSALSDAILAGMGLTSESHPRAYADIDEGDVKRQKSASNIGDAALNHDQKGMVGGVVEDCAIGCGLPQDVRADRSRGQSSKRI